MSVMSSNHLIVCQTLLPPSIFPNIRVFSNESVLCIRWPKYWNFSFSMSPSNEYSGLISFRMGLVGSPCSPRDPQESSPAPQFKSINSSVLSFLYSPTLTSIHMKVKTTVSQLCPTLCDPKDCIRGILYAIILEWVAFPFSRGSSQPRDRTQVSCMTTEKTIALTRWTFVDEVMSLLFICCLG